MKIYKQNNLYSNNLLVTKMSFVLTAKISSGKSCLLRIRKIYENCGVRTHNPLPKPHLKPGVLTNQPN